MRINLVRSVALTFGVIAILLIAPTVCAASMDMTTMTHDSASHQGETKVPKCLSTSASPLSHHILMNAVGEQVTPNRLILNQDICRSWSPVDLSVEPSTNEGKPVQADIRDHAPPLPPIERHCRSYLRSEEPPAL